MNMTHWSSEMDRSIPNKEREREKEYASRLPNESNKTNVEFGTRLEKGVITGQHTNNALIAHRDKWSKNVDQWVY